MTTKSLDSFKTRSTLAVGNRTYVYYSLAKLKKAGLTDPSDLPVSLGILLENLLRNEDGVNVKREDIEALTGWNPKAKAEREISFMPARVILQDFTGVPAVVDLAAMRDAVKRLGGDPKAINPLLPVDLVIDHSIQVDSFGSPEAAWRNAALEFDRNRERYEFLKWGQNAFRNFRVVPPGTGIVHQVNLEYLAEVVFRGKENGGQLAYPDTVIGTDSHTTMINGLGVLGWGVGGIEAEAAMLGQPVSMLIPEVVGFRLKGSLSKSATATDLVLTVTQMLRKAGVVGKFVEFFGDSLEHLSLPDRATIANMAPEYGATIGFFPIDEMTIDYLKLTGRGAETVACVEAYAKAQGFFREKGSKDRTFTNSLELDLGTVERSLAGPRRPQDRVRLGEVKSSFRKELPSLLKGKTSDSKNSSAGAEKSTGGLNHGSVVIAAITSCTNTSNPSVMLGAGLLAKKAVERGLKVKPWVKTSFAPGSKVVTEYLKAAGLTRFLEALNFHLVGYGCTTCIGNSGPLPEHVAQAIREKNLVAAAVLSGNRNFEGRIHSLVRANYLASPPLVVAYALVGTVDVDLEQEAIGVDSSGREVYLRDIWPTQAEISQAAASISPRMFEKEYSKVFDGGENWKSIEVAARDTFEWQPSSTYVKNPPFFETLSKLPPPLKEITGARVLAFLGDSVTTDHISPAGSIAPESPAGRYLIGLGVRPEDFNSYGARRGNFEVMMRGTFANSRIRNLLCPDSEGGVTRYLPSGERIFIYDAAVRYARAGIPLLVLAGKEYGAGSSRDWAAKGPALLGVRAVIAESFERIHRSNLIGMGILPLQFEEGASAASLGLNGEEVFEIAGTGDRFRPGSSLDVKAKGKNTEKNFSVIVRIDTPTELAYYQNGGILQYVLRKLI